MDVIVFSVPHADCPPGRLTSAISARRLEGCIVLPSFPETHPLMREALALGFPCVNFEGIIGPRCSTVLSDDYAGAIRIARLLLDRGHRTIGYIDGPPNVRVCRSRYEGFRQALTERGLEHDPSLLATGDFSGVSGAAAATELLRRHPSMTAVACANDLMAMGAIQALAAAGASVPQDVSVVGYDGDFFTAYTVPPLTTIRHDHDGMAEHAADQLIGLLHGQSGGSDTVMPLPIERGSVADFPQEVRKWTRQRLRQSQAGI